MKNEVAEYIIRIVKSVNKDKNYALSIVEWYTFNSSQDKEVKQYINKHF